MIISSGNNGDRLSFDINIVDDTLVEMTESINLLATTTDLNTGISPDTVIVFIFDNDGELAILLT